MARYRVTMDQWNVGSMRSSLRENSVTLSLHTSKALFLINCLHRFSVVELFPHVSMINGHHEHGNECNTDMTVTSVHPKGQWLIMSADHLPSHLSTFVENMAVYNV